MSAFYKQRFLSFLILIVILTILGIAAASGANLPTVDGDSNTWGTILNDYLRVEHNANGSHSNLTVYDGDVNFSSPSGDGFFWQNSTRRVGIGAISPTHTFNVYGATNFSNGDILLGDSNVNISSTYVGIGTFSPTHTFNLYGAVNFSNGDVLLGDSNINMSSTYVGIGAISPTSKLHIHDGDVNFSDGVEAGFFYEDGNKRVGIRIDYPSVELDVRGDGNFSGIIYVGNSSQVIGSTELNLSYINTYALNESYSLNTSLSQYVDWTLGNDTYARLNSLNTFSEINHFSANVTFADNVTIGGNVLYVDSSAANVGIGIASPTNKLTVEGTGNFTGGASGDAVSIILSPNATDITCDTSTAGGIIYTPNGHLGCNGTEWNALY